MGPEALLEARGHEGRHDAPELRGVAQAVRDRGLVDAFGERRGRRAVRVLRSAAGATSRSFSRPRSCGTGFAFSIVDRGVEPGTTYRYRVNVVERERRPTLFETECDLDACDAAHAASEPSEPVQSLDDDRLLPAGGERGDARGVRLDREGSSRGSLTASEAGRRGRIRVGWRGLDAQGRSVSSGVYFYRLTSGKETISRKMMLLRYSGNRTQRRSCAGQRSRHGRLFCVLRP